MRVRVSVCMSILMIVQNSYKKGNHYRYSLKSIKKTFEHILILIHILTGHILKTCFDRFYFFFMFIDIFDDT